MRKLNTTDVFKAFRLITKSGLKDKLNAYIDQLAKGEIESLETVGFSGFMTILEALTDEKCEKLFYEFLSNPYEMKPSEVASLELDKQMELLKQLYEENNLKSFFIALSGLMKTKS